MAIDVGEEMWSAAFQLIEVGSAGTTFTGISPTTFRSGWYLEPWNLPYKWISPINGGLGLEHESYDFPLVGNGIIIPTDELTPSFFRGVNHGSKYHKRGYWFGGFHN